MSAAADAGPDPVLEVDVFLELEAPPDVLLEDDGVLWRGLESLAVPDVRCP